MVTEIDRERHLIPQEAATLSQRVGTALETPSIVSHLGYFFRSISRIPNFKAVSVIASERVEVPYRTLQFLTFVDVNQDAAMHRNFIAQHEELRPIFVSSNVSLLSAVQFDIEGQLDLAIERYLGYNFKGAKPGESQLVFVARNGYRGAETIDAYYPEPLRHYRGRGR